LGDGVPQIMTDRPSHLPARNSPVRSRRGGHSAPNTVAVCRPCWGLSDRYARARRHRRRSGRDAQWLLRIMIKMTTGLARLQRPMLRGTTGAFASRLFGIDRVTRTRALGEPGHRRRRGYGFESRQLHHVFHGCRDQWFCGGLCPVACVPVRMPWSGVTLGFDSPKVFCCILLKLRHLMCWFPSGPAGASPVAVTGSCRWVAPGKRSRPAPPAAPLRGPRRVAVSARPSRQLRPSAWTEQMTVTVPSSGAAPSHPPGVEMAGGRDGQPDSMRGTRTQVGPGHLCFPPMRTS
jgi:hypothetical protein